MQIQKQNIHRKKQIKSLYIHQQSLQLDLQNVIAGQTVFLKLVLLLLIVMLCFIAGIFAGLVGCITSLNIIVKDIVRLPFIAMVLVVSAAIATAIFQNLSKSLLLVISSFFAVVIVIELIAKFDFIELSHTFIPMTIVVTAFCLGSSSVSFFVIRFMIALTDIVFSYSILTKILIISTLFLAAVVGSSTAINVELQAKNSGFKEVLLSSNLPIVITVCGTI
ncbi:hypothetical protein [Iningainema tapete]|uniref:Uncharacterized protein n=1 Tax=Iningainema tapete BLCC-T55 TaxID=2748662 RepID=A0A8J6XH01_9CYAN|nr:hypothetical protein [Iningainema tapete]MBD2774143.1 hypothetical protein [Iningainema tapete BLCC-T55]